MDKKATRITGINVVITTPLNWLTNRRRDGFMKYLFGVESVIFAFLP
jgi:hypothetical protein